MTVTRAHDRTKHSKQRRERLREWLAVERRPMVRTQRADRSGWRTETYGPLPGMGTVRDPRFSDGTPRRLR